MSETHSDESSTDSIKHRFLWHAHEYQSEYVRHADAKATFSAGIAVAALGFLYHENTHLPWDQACSHLVVAWFSFFFSVVASVVLVVSLFCALFAVSPLLPHKHSSQKSDGFIYWKNIAEHENFDKLKESFDQQKIDTLNYSILHHIWDISTLVLVPKYSRVRWCVRLLAIGVFLAGISLMLNPHHYVTT